MKTILCPTDFSPVAQNALLYAAEIGKKSGAEVILFHTEFFPEPVSKEDEDLVNLPSEYVSELKERLESLIIQLRNNYPEVKFRYAVEEGLVAENIALYATKNNVDLIVMGTSGTSGLDAIFTGSNTVRVMEKAHCPTFVIPENYEYRVPSLFVYATDPTEDDEMNINRVSEVAKLFGAEVEILQMRKDDEELVDSEVSLNSLVQRLSVENVKPDVVKLKRDVSEIKEYAKSHADILAMTSRKQNFFEKLFNQNIVEKIAYEANIPLLILNKP